TSCCRLLPPRPAKSLLHPEAPTSYHKLPQGRTPAEEPRGSRLPGASTFFSEGTMLPQSAPTPQPPGRFGVGIDTSRYGHYAAFLRDDSQQAANELGFTESADGYEQLRKVLKRIADRHPGCHIHVRIDAAGQYADNLIHFLHTLANPDADAARLANARHFVS